MELSEPPPPPPKKEKSFGPPSLKSQEDTPPLMHVPLLETLDTVCGSLLSSTHYSTLRAGYPYEWFVTSNYYFYSTDCAIFLCERAYSCWSWSLYCPGHRIFGCPVQMLSQKKIKESPLFWKGQDLSLVALYNRLILERLSHKRVRECTKLAKQPAKHSPSSLNADNLVFIALKCSVERQ